MSSSVKEFPPHVLREYSFLGDGERGALVGPRGEVTWMCAPRWDSGSVFGRLIGARGLYAVTPRGRFVWGGYYEPGTLIWRSRWVTDDGIVECREALALPADPHRVVLLRRIEPVSGAAELDLRLDPAADYGRVPVSGPRHTGGVWTADVGPLRLRWSGGADTTFTEANGWDGTVRVPEGDHHDLVLELADRPLPAVAPSADDLWQSTERAWKETVPRFAGALTPADARHAYAVMRGMTSSGGGMVAACTTSLPERADSGRSYDYRYVWVRDQCFAAQAVAADGPHPLLDDALGFVTERLLDDGPDLAPAYLTTGGRVPDQQHLGLPGYPGGLDIVGNHVNAQFQLDAFGEALSMLAAAARLDRLDAVQWRAAQVAAAAIAERWSEPDAGIWELAPKKWTHSRLTAAAGLEAMARARPSAPAAREWQQLADHIRADTARHAVRPDGAWQRSPDDDRLDGALLLPPLRAPWSSNDARTRATLDCYLTSLTEDGYAYRFREHDKPLGTAEGAFLLCGFLTSMALNQQGRTLEAARWFERTRASAGPPQLYSEEFDATQHQLRGNLPQAFVHAFLLETTLRLAADPVGSVG